MPNAGPSEALPLPFYPVGALLDAQGEDRCRLDATTIVLWGVILDGPQDCQDRCRRSLSDEESARADRFIRDEDRQRYIFAHGCLRLLLGRCLNVEPGAVTFQLGPSGKPVLCHTTHGSDLSFNLSHAHGRALIAIAQGREVGVDLERIRPDIAVEKLSTRYFSPGEQTMIMQSAQEERPARFFRYWVAKEAVLKAQGVGLRSLSQCEVLLAADGAGAEVLAPADSLRRDSWTIRFLSCGEGWDGAVAAQGKDWTARGGLVR
ncbi:MAG: 4'-phosphopantetheinyl transferase superfamily protein [Nitrospirae bacterium]|nr:4'-phosphopantetheinyl transferase superfamily protein [Nitrospirota bacterium]